MKVIQEPPQSSSPAVERTEPVSDSDRLPVFQQDRFRALVTGQARGVRAALERRALHCLSVPYSAVTSCRNWLYDRGLLASHRLDVPVISVGNITTGGTGKTPFVMWLVKRLREKGVRPGILSRGYQRGADRPEAPSGSDEIAMMRDNLGEVPIYVGADRVRSGRRAVDQGVQALILDDGFQHRRLRRDVDLVLVDAMCPFGFGHVLPRGTLRESRAGFARASGFVITRSDQVGGERLREIRKSLAATAPDRPIAEAVHRPTALCSLTSRSSQPVGSLAGRKVLLVAGVGNPEAFRATAEGLGAELLGMIAYPDHHVFTAADTSWIRYQVVETGADLVLTTEKDVARGDELVWAGVETAYLKVSLEVVEGEADLLALLDRI